MYDFLLSVALQLNSSDSPHISASCSVPPSFMSATILFFFPPRPALLPLLVQAAC